MRTISIDHFDALLFDLDGTLADSMLVHNQAWITTLNNKGHQMSMEILNEYAGVPNVKIVEIFNQRFGWSLDPILIALEKDHQFIQNMNKIKPIKPIYEIVLNYFGQKPMAIVSGGTRDMVGQILNFIELTEKFPVKVCADDVTKGKPHPESFLLAAQKLNIQPEKCLVFEDGEAGIQGARAAGMGVIKVNSDFTYHFLFPQT